MLKFSTSANDARERRIMNGTVYPFVAAATLEQAVAINDAAIRLKFITPRLDAKCLVP
jgi:hypothetical protein